MWSPSYSWETISELHSYTHKRREHHGSTLAIKTSSWKKYSALCSHLKSVYQILRGRCPRHREQKWENGLVWWRGRTASWLVARDSGAFPFQGTSCIHRLHLLIRALFEIFFCKQNKSNLGFQPTFIALLTVRAGDYSLWICPEMSSEYWHYWSFSLPQSTHETLEEAISHCFHWNLEQRLSTGTETVWWFPKAAMSIKFCFVVCNVCETHFQIWRLFENHFQSFHWQSTSMFLVPSVDSVREKCLAHFFWGINDLYQ
jgi:hypothetical protein